MWGICFRTQLPRNARDMLPGILVFHFSMIPFQLDEASKNWTLPISDCDQQFRLKHLHNTQNHIVEWEFCTIRVLNCLFNITSMNFFGRYHIFPINMWKNKAQQEAFCLNKREKNCLNQTRKEILKGTFRSISRK